MLQVWRDEQRAEKKRKGVGMGYGMEMGWDGDGMGWGKGWDGVGDVSFLRLELEPGAAE